MKKPKKFIWRLFFSYIFITIGALSAAGWYFVHSLDAFLHDLVVVELSERARLLRNQILPHLEPPDPSAVDAVCKQAGKASESRFTVILPSGVVIGDTWETPQNMDNHAGRPEVAGALAGGQASSRRFSNTLQRNVVYVAVSVTRDSLPIGVVRAAVPLARVEALIAHARTQFWGIGGILGLLALAVTFVISRQYGRKLQALKQGAARLAQGELAHRLPIPDSEELAGLAESLNRMAAQLENRLQTVVSQRNQLEAVLSSMLEGVIAVSRDERIISINMAAARWFDIDPEKVRGRSIPEAIRNIALQKFVSRAFQSRTPLEEDVTVYRDGECTLNVKSAPLLDVGPEPLGMLIVFSDVTRLRRLEDVRRDFVANVSHEIKTPLTAIKGFVETLHQNIVETPEEAERFLGIISRHVDRLNAIIEDLLMLSRIENEGERGDIKRERTRLRDIIQNAVQICRPPAEEKRIGIELGGDDQLTAMVDPVLIEQAVVNLLDNALKYSDREKSVQIRALTVDREIRIQVQDHGIGIEKKHLPRLFERFYRVDKARSRSLGGTGLGLAIVKHIAQAHGGHVTVESRLGEGSLFTIHLPRDPQQP
ncbi:MAG TPA: ATP-binding protein [Desulfobacterales bacterium]|nr:ATP-binding protein [Desulfobacterales bacterium]